MKTNGTDFDNVKKSSDAKGGKFLSAFCSVTGTIGVIMIILLCIPVTIPGFLGYRIYNVVSESMEPALPVGSIIYSKTVEPSGLEEGDIIVFNNNGMTVTHRVVRNDTDAKELITKGDANPQEDPTPVRYGSVIGKAGLHIPYMGGFFEFFTSLKGKIYLMGVLVASFVLMIIGSSLKGKSFKR